MCGHEARRGPQGASRAVPGKSGLHAHGEGELVITLESWETARSSRGVEEGPDGDSTRVRERETWGDQYFDKLIPILYFPWLLSCFSRVRLCATPWTAAYQAPQPMGFSRQEYRSGVPLQPHRRQPTRLCRPWDSPGTQTDGAYLLLFPLLLYASQD